VQVTFFLLGSGQNWSSEFLPLSKFLQFSFLLSCKYFLGTQKIFCHGAIVFPPLGIAVVDVKSEPLYCMFCGPSTSNVSLSEGSIGPSTGKTSCRGGKNRRAREHCSQKMLNICRKIVWITICYWKFEGNLNSHVPLYGRNNIWLTDIIPWI
jgi:hypothetical protein